jgi:predicted ferric reductase
MAATYSGFLTLFLLVFVLLPPLRMTAIGKALGGLPRSFRLHHVVGVSLPVVGGVHAALAMFPYLAAAESFPEAVGFFFDFSDTQVVSGTLSWLLLTFTVVASFWTKLHRTPWLWLHRVSVLGFLFALVHFFLGPMEAFSSPSGWADVGRLAGAALSITALVGVLLHFARPEILANHRKFVVTGIERVGGNVVELTLELGKGRGTWHGGDFGYFRFDCRGECGVSRERHPFTIVDMIHDTTMKIVVKAVGADTAGIQHILFGTTGEVSGPYGTLSDLLSQRSAQLWIAGGLGMMPFLGLARRLGDRSAEAADVALIVLHRPGQEPPRLSELQELAARRPGLKIMAFESVQNATVGIEAVAVAVPDWKQRTIALAGPHAMIDDWTRTLRSRGIPQSNIHTEDFTK